MCTSSLQSENQIYCKVSVIIPNYNYARYLKKRISSILKQTYPVYELILLDDNSSDNSKDLIEAIVKEIKIKFPKLKVKTIFNSRNSGKAILQWEKGIENVTGDYVWIAEADDLSNRRFLETVMRGFDDPKVILSYTESRLINSFGVMISPNFKWSRDREKTGHYKYNYLKDGQDEVREILAIRCTIPNVSAVVFRREVLTKQLLKEASDFKQVGDWFLYLNIVQKGKIAYFREPFNYFRIHRNSVTRESNVQQIHYNEIIKIHRWLLNTYDLPEITKQRMKIERQRIGKRHRY